LIGYVRVDIARRQKRGVPAVTKLDGWVRYNFEMDSARKPIPGAKSWVPQRIIALTRLNNFRDVLEVSMVVDDGAPKQVNSPRTNFDLSKHIEDLPRL